MGVKGFHRVLQEEGWLPDEAGSPCCSTSLWREASVMHACPRFAANVSLVKRRSTLFIDGAGLSFHLYRIAYARHAAQVLSQTEGRSRRRSSVSCSCSAKNLTEEQVTRLLPNLLPLTALDEVTKEFVDTLKNKHHMKLVVYFDGGKRREAKKETDEKRRQKRPVEWSAVQQYCCNGIMPSVDKVCQWEDRFPKNRLFFSQVKYTLNVLEVDIVACLEEADAEIARQASRTPHSYVVGNDTDFCFFPKARYIPLKTLHADASVVTGSIISRKELAQSLHLPNEDAMVELAILMGNDYVGSFSTDKFDYGSKNAREIMDHLRSKGEGYRVKSTSGDETETAIRFARTLYQLKNLDEEFPLVSPNYEIVENEIDEIDEYEELTMKIPQGFPLELALVQPGDTSVKGAIVRCLQAYLEQQQQSGNGNNDRPVFDQIHLTALKQMSSHRLEDKSPPWKPQWEDMPACYLIESCIAYTLRRSAASPLVRLTPPGKLFGCYLFHQTLFQIRNRNPGSPRSKNRAGSVGSKKSDSAKSAQRRGSSSKKLEPRPMLPIDEHEERIIATINNNRVTIIQGETGCGKSTRVPIMVMKAATPDPALSEVRLFISQPRRIAAKALVERLRATEPELGKTIALRMGHGVREYETSATRAVFCTTGYVVRLLSNHPENFNKVSHLIIDEIHERSVDTDILCLLCRRLLRNNPHIRLILMSATLAAKLYQDYFDIAEAPIKVGARRFPIEEVFVEELPARLRLAPKEIKAVRQLESECQKSKCITPPSNGAMENLYNLAARIAITVGQPGSSVLIFVPGMRDIEGITEIIEKTYCPGLSFTCIPIHSDIPFEDQMTVFDEKTEEVKIIIATNAAESSITLPDCDHVICTGLQKQITYNPSSHRQMLSPCWISRASAQQRSGRVGRVRPGTVFRLYTREAYETMMKEFESGEMLRMPLDSVILMLKEILNEATTQALLDCLEPPDLSTIERSYDSLYSSNFISQPDDSGTITNLGSFVSALGVDLTLGALIGLGIQFGVGVEAIELAAVLSFPKTPWLMSNALVHKPKSFNSGTAKTYFSKNRLDAGLFSEPLATMNLIHEYKQLHGSRLSQFCNYHGVHNTRIRRLMSTRDNLIKRVGDFVKIDDSSLKVTVPPAKLHHSKLNILRVIQVWVFSEIIEYKPLPHIKPKSDVFEVPVKVAGGSELEESHLETVLRKNHSYSLNTRTEHEQSGSMNSVGDEPFDLVHFLVGFEDRFVSYVVDNDLDLAWFWFETGLQLYASSAFSETHEFETIKKLWDDFADESVLRVFEAATGSRRGRGERASGRWSIQDPFGKVAEGSTSVTIKRFSLNEIGLADGISNMIRTGLKKTSSVKNALSFDFSRNSGKRKKKGNNVVFQIFTCGPQDLKVSDIDCCDLLSIPRRQENYRLLDKGEARSQSILFDFNDNSPEQEGEEQVSNPLLKNAPEGARLLAILAASRRREANIHIPLPSDEADSEEQDEDELICFSLEHGLARMTQRWTRLNTDRAVFAYENSVPASVIPIGCTGALYACCANTLDLRGGGLRADGLTLLPPGSFFLLLSLLAVGRTPDGLGSFPDVDSGEEEVDLFIADAVSWAKLKDAEFVEEGADQSSEPVDWASRLKMTINFARSCDNLGHRLVCYPDKVKSLCEIFDGVDGYSAGVWPTLPSDPFIPKTEREQKFITSLLAEMRHPSSFYEGYKSDEAADFSLNRLDDSQLQDESGQQSLPSPSPLDASAKVESAQEEKKSKESDKTLRGEEVYEFSEELRSKSLGMFAAEMPTGRASVDEPPTTNIMAFIAKHAYNGLVFEAAMQPNQREELLEAAERFSAIQLTRDQWVIRRFDHGGKAWYQARFVESSLPLKNRAYRDAPKWARYLRPWIMEQARACVPPQYRDFVVLQAEVYEADDTKMKSVLFESIETALRMEAAFFLERNFWSRKHWYEQPFHELMQQLSKRVPPSSQILQSDPNS